MCGQEYVREASADDKSSSGFSQDLLDDVKTKTIKDNRVRKITTETERLQSFDADKKRKLQLQTTGVVNSLQSILRLCAWDSVNEMYGGEIIVKVSVQTYIDQ